MKKQLKSLLVRPLAFVKLVLTTLIVRPVKWTLGLLGRMVSPFWIYLIRPVLSGIFWLVRKLIRWILLIGLLATAIFSSRWLPPNYEKSRPVTLTEAKLPPLKGRIPANGIRISPKQNLVEVAIILPEIGGDDGLATDLVALFGWGRSYLRPFVCGPDYPPNLCVQGWAEITVLQPETISDENGREVVVLYKYFTIGLDQTQIPKLMEEPPTTFDDLLAFLEVTTKTTQGTGVVFIEYDPPELFEGFK